MKKRVLSALLALAMVVSSTPARVFATGGEAAPQQPAATQVESQGEVQDTPQDEEQGTPQGDTQGEVQGEPTPQGELQPALFDSGDITYIDANGDTVIYNGAYTTVTKETTSWKNGWYLVEGAVAIPQQVVASGEVTLVLADGAQLDARRGI